MTKTRFRNGLVVAMVAFGLFAAGCGRTNLRRAGAIDGDAGADDGAPEDGSGGESSSDLARDTEQVMSLLVSPEALRVVRGERVSFVAWAQMSGGRVVDVTDLVQWSTSDQSVAVSVGGGVFQGVAPGESTVTAQLGQLSDSAQLAVDLTTGDVELLNVDPVTTTLVGVSSSLQLRAWAVYRNGKKADVTSLANWVSTSASVVTVAAGRATAVAQGVSTVRASWGGVSGEATVRVTTQPVTAVSIAPSSQTVAVNAAASFKAEATLADSSHHDVTASALWAASPASVASIVGGVATGLKPGKATVTALIGGLQGTANLTVTSATLASLQIHPANPQVGVGVTIRFTATGSYTDGSSRDVTNEVTWSSSSPAVVVIDRLGVAQSMTAGTSVVGASLGGRSSSSTVTVMSAALRSISVTPAASTLAPNATVQLSAVGQYTNGVMVDLTASVIWTAAPAGIVSVSNAATSPGLMTALGAGTAIVSAAFGALSGAASVVVSPPSLTGLVVRPDATTIAAGTSVQLHAIGTYSDNTVQDVTAMVMWSTSNASIATVSNGSGSQGTVAGAAPGTATITAKLGTMSATSTVTVTAAVLKSIAVTPANGTVAAGQSLQYTATGAFSDGSTTNLTALVTWSTGNSTTATISNLDGARGLLQARAPGSTSVKAVLGSESASTRVTVTAPILTGVRLSPSPASAPAGVPVQFQAVAVYSDGRWTDVTSQASWGSSVPAVAVVSNAAGSRGLTTTWAAGSTTISASYQGFSGSATLTVGTATVQRIQLSPPTPTVPIGFSQQMTAIATYSDGTSREVTPEATWTSSNATAASVGDAGSTKGLVAALAVGTTTITAQIGSIWATTTVTVSGVQLTKLTVSPAVASAAVNAYVLFSATGAFSDGSTQDVSAYVTWASSNWTVADISNAADSRGLAKAFAPGSTVITAQSGTVSGAALLTVK